MIDPSLSQRLMDTEHRLVAADRTWRSEVNRRHGSEGVLLYRYGPIGCAEGGTRQRVAFELRQVAVAEWRRVRTRVACAS